MAELSNNMRPNQRRQIIYSLFGSSLAFAVGVASPPGVHINLVGQDQNLTFVVTLYFAGIHPFMK